MFYLSLYICVHIYKHIFLNHWRVTCICHSSLLRFRNLTSIQYLCLFYHLQPIFMNYASNVLYTVQGGAVVKNPPASAGGARNLGSIPGLGRSPGIGNGCLLQYSCLEIQWTEEPGGLQSMGLKRVVHNWVTEYTDRQTDTHSPLEHFFSPLYF